jgi:hypothetical protein
MHDPFHGPHGSGADPFAGPDDFLSQLLLAGARSAHEAHRSGSMGAGGFTHYDPASGAASFEPGGAGAGAAGGAGGAGPHMGHGLAGVPQGLEALIGALMGPGMFGGMMGGAAAGGMRYEDLAGLQNVAVTTPPEVLARLPRSTYIDGRRPGDRCGCSTAGGEARAAAPTRCGGLVRPC